MKKRSNSMTLTELKSLYPDIKLMDGYDAAFVGVVPAPQSGCIAVYDSTKIIDILSESGFTTQKDLVAHFEKVVSSAQIKDGSGKIGPLFMQSVTIRDEESNTITEADLEEHRARIERHRREDEEEEAEWHTDYGLEGEEGQEGEPGDDDFDDDSDSESDSDSDSEHYYIGEITFEEAEEQEESDDDEDDDDLADSGYDEEPEAPYMEIIVEIGLNSPKDCMITRDVRKIKEAMRLIFPKLPRLDMISKANFILRELSDLEDADTEDGDDEFPYMPPGSL
jgi:hypothetical protein